MAAAVTSRAKAIETTAMWFNGSKLRRDAFVVLAAMWNAPGEELDIQATVCRLQRIVDIDSVTFVEFTPYAPAATQDGSSNGGADPHRDFAWRRRPFAAQISALWSALAWPPDGSRRVARSRVQLLSVVTAVPLRADGDVSLVDVVFENEWRNEQYDATALAAHTAVTTEQLVLHRPWLSLRQTE